MDERRRTVRGNNVFLEKVGAPFCSANRPPIQGASRSKSSRSGVGDAHDSRFLEHHPWGLAAFSATTSVDECNASFTELRQCAPRGSLPAPNPAAPTPRRWGPRGARKWSNRGPALALLRVIAFRVSARTGLFCGVRSPTLCWRAEGLWRHDRRAYQRHVCDMCIFSTWTLVCRGRGWGPWGSYLRD